MKPFVLCHMCTSIDGKILGQRWGRLPGPKQSVELFESTAASLGIGAWIVGTETMTEFCHAPFRLPAVSGRASMEDFVARHDARTLAIGVDARGRTFWKSSEVQGDHVVLLITEATSAAYRAHLRAAGVSYLFCGKRSVDLAVGLDKLARAFKLKKLALQGGGKLNGSFLAQGLIDEISHITVPIADGGVGVSGFFDIPGPAPAHAAAKLRLIWRRSLPGSVLWTRYRVLPGRAVKAKAPPRKGRDAK